MALGEVARCYRCNTFASADELQLDRTTRPLYEYICRDVHACQQRQNNREAIQKDALRHRKATKPYKPVRV